MESYYDVAKLERFDEIFGGTWIHENPTNEKNSYLMLCFNFSAINPQIDLLEESFEAYTRGVFSAFISKYKKYFDSESFEEYNTPQKLDHFQM